jgi:hypothetical protein
MGFRRHLLFISGPAFFVCLYSKQGGIWNRRLFFYFFPSALETLDKISNGPRRPPVAFSLPYPSRHLRFHPPFSDFSLILGDLAIPLNC